ncbi:hypothetical protein ACTXPE_05330 [Psychrobacter celer]|nr:hypothetical protein [Psychrobacter sp. Marseille-P5312]
MDSINGAKPPKTQAYKRATLIISTLVQSRLYPLLPTVTVVVIC